MLIGYNWQARRTSAVLAAFGRNTGHSNAKSEGINRVIKLVACAAFGFTGSPTPITNAYAHAATPPAAPTDTSHRSTLKTRVRP
ncbi:hypothetical protein WBG99_21020 [Streptomyces sp. TG1A-60]|uniref:hypothetical protein n=1 Tax=Streptomyces sp. TG1A-60 TaxID=3129111 RepID=UPI0030CAAF5C